MERVLIFSCIYHEISPKSFKNERFDFNMERFWKELYFKICIMEEIMMQILLYHTKI